MLTRLVHGFIAVAFTACVHAVASSHRRADTVKGSKLGYTTVAMKCEPIVYSSLLTLAKVVLAAPEPMLARLVRGCIALAFTSGVRAVASSHRLADDPVKERRTHLHDSSNGTRANHVQLATYTGKGGPGRP